MNNPVKADITLAISTSCADQQVAVALPGRSVLSRCATWRRGQPRTLLADIHALLAQADADFADVQRIVCDVGPGSFTGVRFGLSTARALAWATGARTCAVTSLDAMRRESAQPAQSVLVALPSRRRYVYAQLSVGGTSEPREWSHDEVRQWLAGAHHRKIAAPTSTLDELDAPQRQLVVQAPARIETFLSLAHDGPWGDAQTLLPRYAALSQPERLAAGA